VIGVTERDNKEIRKTWTEAKSERIQCLVEQLRWHMRNYGNLEKREAQLGKGNVPVEDMNRMDMTREQINRILHEIQGEDGLIKDVENVIIDVI
jgi:hypothetical protein